jgi:hypothetical protein
MVSNIFDKYSEMIGKSSLANFRRNTDLVYAVVVAAGIFVGLLVD